jgi:hypothetical protein
MGMVVVRGVEPQRHRDTEKREEGRKMKRKRDE